MPVVGVDAAGPDETDDVERPPRRDAPAGRQRAAPGVRRTSRRRSRRRSAAGPGAPAARHRGSGGRPRSCPSAPAAGRPPPRTRRGVLCGQRASRPARSGIGAAAIASAAGSRPIPNPSRTTRTIGRGRRGRFDPAVTPRRAARGGHASAGHDPGHLVGLERGAADERAVDRWLGQELADVGGRDAAAVEDRHAIRGLAPAEPQQRAADRVGHRRRVRAARVPAGPDRPDGLVGDDQPGRAERRRLVSRRARRRAVDRRSAPCGPPRGRSSCSPTHRIGRSPASTARPSFRPISSSVSPASRRRSEWPTMTHDASPASIGARSRPCTRRRARDGCSGRRRRPPGPHRRARRRTAARHTNGGQMTRIDGRFAASDRRWSWPAPPPRRGSCASSSWPPRSRHASRRIMPERPTAEWLATGHPAASASSPCRASRSIRSSARCTADRWIDEPLRELAQASPRASRAGPPRPAGRRCGCAGQTAVRVEDRDRVELAPRRTDRSLEVRRLGVQDPVEIAPQRPRHLPGLKLEQGATGADPTQERPDRLPALPGHDAAGAPEPPRGRQVDVGQPCRELASLVRRAARTRGGSGRRPGSETHAARNRPRSHADRQWSAARSQSNGARVPASSTSRRSRNANRATWPSREACGWADRPEPVRLRGAIAWPGRVDPRELGPQRDDEIALGAGHRRSATDRPSAGAALALERPDHGLGQPRWVVVMARCRDRRPLRARAAAPAAGRAATAGEPVRRARIRARGPRTGCWR